MLLFNFLLPPNLKNVLAKITGMGFGKTTLIRSYWSDVEGKGHQGMNELVKSPSYRASD